MGTTVKGKEQVIKRYFNSWIVPNFKDFEDTFSKNASYSECYSPIYRNKAEIIAWYKDWNKNWTSIGMANEEYLD